MPSHNTNDLIQKITEEVTEKVKEAFTRKMQDQLDMLQARINFLESNKGQNRNPCGQVQDATSGHEVRRESIGEGVHPHSTSNQEIDHAPVLTKPL
ncbi:hypothetical protein RchiOBHm_Chr5g0068021 [Rosa chinensis]|uniref:Uncharacterized protein n=1 Tax=Rosa chinensis TaxID=74649 RepID=A0A2P6QJM2_ROSCH|nr:hypothetical protein RchiOBHm_Chr5g0068021 [Rosa chinensis]